MGGVTTVMWSEAPAPTSAILDQPSHSLHPSPPPLEPDIPRVLAGRSWRPFRPPGAQRVAMWFRKVTLIHAGVSERELEPRATQAAMDFDIVWVDACVRI